MPNQTQQIINKAKELGYVPEKKISKSQIPDYKDRSVVRACDERDIPKLVFIWQNQLTDFYNQAIDAFQLEKIIELAYERGFADGELYANDMEISGKSNIIKHNKEE